MTDTSNQNTTTTTTNAAPDCHFAQSVLVTGASRGVGLELVRQLAQASPPPRVLLATCRDQSRAAALQEIARANACVTVLQMDVEKDADIEAAVQTTRCLVGEAGLNLLINNAGLVINKPDGGGLRRQTRDRMQRTFNVNATSPVIVTQKFLPLLEQAASCHPQEPLSCRKAASIIVSSSKGSQEHIYHTASNTHVDYNCSKTAVNMATILMAQDLREVGVLVAAMHPGWVRTAMGGPEGLLDPRESVAGMLATLRGLGEKDMGLVTDYKGDKLTF